MKGKLNRSVAQLPEPLAKMEACFLGPLELYIDPTDKNKGERKNCQVSLQLVIQRLACQVIFLTDELRIVRTGFIKHAFDAYPIGQVWSSLDFVLYLYLKHKRFDYETAEAIIQDVNSMIGGKDEDMLNRLSVYLKRLGVIESARRQLPNLWRN